MNVTIENLFESIGRLYVENTHLNKMVAEQRATKAAQVPAVQPESPKPMTDSDETE